MERIKTAWFINGKAIELTPLKAIISPSKSQLLFERSPAQPL
ncbi:hypothetical protein SAMN05216490_3476 [Mucilaginibacter mallensis]|uniref:Uncharacterized protein n=1 Tax=Mucilaginibacter mallensis TaxID=652787 RepID=A0A1H2ADY8_MUCMA|nr:hypothetical protein SAMN05216490_3476 [Mucilaginibacter mallensis]